MFQKGDGAYVQQWKTTGSQPSMDDMRAMYVTQAGSAQNPKTPQVYWATPNGIFRTALTPVEAKPAASPGAGADG